MIVCHCHCITDRTIREKVRDGLRTTAAVARACDAGTGCGGCRRLISEIVHDEHHAQAPVQHAKAS